MNDDNNGDLPPAFRGEYRDEISIRNAIPMVVEICKEKASATGNCWRKGKKGKAIAGGALKILAGCIFIPVYVALVVAMTPFALLSCGDTCCKMDN